MQPPERTNDIVKSLLAARRDSPYGILPVWAFHGQETWTMIGYHAVPVIADAYLKGIRNRGEQADRLVGASTPVAARVELHRMTLDNGVMRMREVAFIELPPKSDTPLRHGGACHLMLIDLKRPLKDGERFDLTLQFERAGARTVQVWVQSPRGESGGAHRH